MSRTREGKRVGTGRLDTYESNSLLDSLISTLAFLNIPDIQLRTNNLSQDMEAQRRPPKTREQSDYESLGPTARS